MPPELTGVLGKLARRLPQGRHPGVFRPAGTSFQFTSKCPGRCRMCFVKEMNGHPAYTIEEARHVLEQVAGLTPGRDKGALDLWGGEPFADFELLHGITRVAAELGFSCIEIITNGFWGKDPATADEQLRQLKVAAGRSKLNLTFSVDDFHQAQELLTIENIANVIHLIETKHPSINYTFHTLPTKNSSATNRLVNAIQKKGLFADFDCDSSMLAIGLNPQYANIKHLLTLTPTFYPTTPDEEKALVDHPPLTPSTVAEDRNPFSPRFAIGLDRNVYLEVHFIPGVLPMGQISQKSLAEIVCDIECHPIAVSLLQHGFGEIYAALRSIFDVDRWIAAGFGQCANLFKGLEVDDPLAAIGQTDELRPILNPALHITLGGRQTGVLWEMPPALISRMPEPLHCRAYRSIYPQEDIFVYSRKFLSFLHGYGFRLPQEREGAEVLAQAPARLKPFAVIRDPASKGFSHEVGFFCPAGTPLTWDNTLSTPAFILIDAASIPEQVEVVLLKAA